MGPTDTGEEALASRQCLLCQDVSEEMDVFPHTGCSRLHRDLPGTLGVKFMLNYDYVF